MSSRQVEKSFVGLAIILPAAFTFYFIYKYGLRVPFWDQWETVLLLEKIHNNTFTLADLWMQHNEHRILFPKILMLLLARWSNWNIFLELCANIVLAAFILLFLLLILRDTLKTVPGWLKIFTSLMVFSMAQYENWSWGWQIQMFLSLLGSVMAIWAVNKWQGKALGLITAISTAVLSSYSFNTGLITWPVLFAVMLLQKKWKLKHIIILILAGIITVLLYYHNYTKCRSNLFIFLFLKHPLFYIRYVLTYLGTSLSFDYSYSFITALIILALILWSIFNIWRLDPQKLQDLAVWPALALYVCMAACITGIGRLDSGWQQAASSRYTSISFLLPLSAAVLLYYAVKLRSETKTEKTSKNMLFIGTITAVFLISYIGCYHSGIKTMKRRSKYINASAYCLNHPQIADDYSLARLYPDPDVVRSRIKILSELNIKFKNDEDKKHK
jgi:hypothetical protein